MNEMLVIKDVEKSFSGVTVLRNINISLAKGEILGIVGENGAGKSTLMNVLGGVYIKNKGSMTLDGSEYDPLTPKDAKENGIAF
ncbi:MAG: ATP-binding cassette domain-containing protein, partial [Spirochaetaceae bacterium]|nr:ATP-binding cassette domain-containing protein [Spirochaetaceae bacterium]